MRIGIDVGGTHTDAVILDGHKVVASTKFLTSENVRSGVLGALDVILAESGAAHDAIEAVMIGTTQFTNAVELAESEKKGSASRTSGGQGPKPSTGSSTRRKSSPSRSAKGGISASGNSASSGSIQDGHLSPVTTN